MSAYKMLLGLSLVLVFSLACRPQQGADAPIVRVVSLTPSLTEIAFALGAGDKVVGVSDFCDYPAEAATRARIGTFLQPNIEKIFGLHPDLVLVDGVQQDVAAVLSGAGTRVLAVPMNSLAEVRLAILHIGEALGDKEEAAAARLLARFDRDLQGVARIASGRSRPKVLFAVDREIGGLRGLIAAGPGSYLDEMVQQAGGDNIFHDLPIRYAKVALEDVLARRPEVILDAVHVSDRSAGDQVLADWQALRDVPAVATGRVFLLSERAFVTPGPRLGQALQELARMLHPPQSH